MQLDQTCGKIKTNPEWVMCPQCRRKKLLRILPTTVVKDLPVLCKQCNREVIVNISPTLEPEP